jgi:hypothetical protein
MADVREWGKTPRLGLFPLWEKVPEGRMRGGSEVRDAGPYGISCPPFTSMICPVM